MPMGFSWYSHRICLTVTDGDEQDSPAIMKPHSAAPANIFFDFPITDPSFAQTVTAISAPSKLSLFIINSSLICSQA